MTSTEAGSDPSDLIEIDEPEPVEMKFGLRANKNKKDEIKTINVAGAAQA